ncbi:MAG: pyruvate kinase alpha/beta domain-containing protein [Nitrososphaeria archaeon]
MYKKLIIQIFTPKNMDKILYFERCGDHTEEVLAFSKKFAEENGVNDIVVASTTGKTGLRASEIFKGYNLVIVTHCAGFREPGRLELKDEYRHAIEGNGGKILVATHALSGVERAFRKKFDTIGPVEIIANAFRCLGEGTKVCIEIALMAADAGLVPVDRDVICIAGTSSGADTSLLIRPSYSMNFFDLKVKKVLCKPANF